VREALHELGWVENQSIHFQSRFAGGRRDRLDQLAGELVKDKVDAQSEATFRSSSPPSSSWSSA
jgi:hypothetical protein